MLDIKNLSASIEDKKILENFNLNIKPGEVHAIIWPNGSGKSTLANVLSGRKGYVVEGKVYYEGNDLLEIPIEERAQKGIFLAFQYPIEIPGVNTNIFLKTSLNAIRKFRGLKELDSLDFLKLVKEKSQKKKNEILQMTILEPKLAILDETDSGLDIDALRIVSEGVNSLRDKKRSFLIITHYQRLLDYIKPDFVHVLVNGKIVKTGTSDLALELEKDGYEGVSITK